MSQCMGLSWKRKRKICLVTVGILLSYLFVLFVSPTTDITYIRSPTMSASTSYLPPSHHFDAFASILRDFDAEASARAQEGGDDQVALLLDDEAGIALRFADVLESM